MKALIIEDETAAALNLKAILKQAAPDIRVVDTLESVEESVDWLRANPQPDLLFMDIHLADGDSFRIFDAVEVTAPVHVRDVVVDNIFRTGVHFVATKTVEE